MYYDLSHFCNNPVKFYTGGNAEEPSVLLTLSAFHYIKFIYKYMQVLYFHKYCYL
jgi:hypothetical protein